MQGALAQRKTAHFDDYLIDTKFNKTTFYSGQLPVLNCFNLTVVVPNAVRFTTDGQTEPEHGCKLHSRPQLINWCPTGEEKLGKIYHRIQIAHSCWGPYLLCLKTLSTRLLRSDSGGATPVPTKGIRQATLHCFHDHTPYCSSLAPLLRTAIVDILFTSLARLLPAFFPLNYSAGLEADHILI